MSSAKMYMMLGLAAGLLLESIDSAQPASEKASAADPIDFRKSRRFMGNPLSIWSSVLSDRIETATVKNLLGLAKCR